MSIHELAKNDGNQNIHITGNLNVVVLPHSLKGMKRRMQLRGWEPEWSNLQNLKLYFCGVQLLGIIIVIRVMLLYVKVCCTILRTTSVFVFLYNWNGLTHGLTNRV